jgi:hypothetical protein
MVPVTSGGSLSVIVALRLRSAGYERPHGLRLPPVVPLHDFSQPLACQGTCGRLLDLEGEYDRVPVGQAAHHLLSVRVNQLDSVLTPWRTLGVVEFI